MNNTKSLPLNYSKSAKAQKGEVFRTLDLVDKSYQVSNLGRVKRIKHTRKMYRNKILKPYRTDERFKFYVRLCDAKCERVQDLVYIAFIGEIPSNMEVVCKDGDRANLVFSNLILQDKSRARRYVKTTKGSSRKLISRAEAMKGLKQEIEISLKGLNEDAKAVQVARLNELSKYYYTDTVKDGVYLLKLKNQ